MRRKELEVKDPEAIDAILAKAQVVRLALSGEDGPYVVPLAFGYDGKALYVHAAHEGKKMDMLRANPRVCFEATTDVELVVPEKGCSFSFKYRSVIGFGAGVIVEDTEAKKEALRVIMRQYSDKEFDITDRIAGSVAIIRVDIESMTGKSRYET